MSARSSSAGSAIRLIELLLPNGGYLMNLIEAYFDESGTHDGSPVMCVAGYLLEAEESKVFTREWNSALSDLGLSHFHMIDCAHGIEEFGQISKQERIDLVIRLIAIINGRVERGLGAMIVAELYDKIMPHQIMGSAYNYCLWHCLEGTRIWADEISYHGDIAYFFESGHKSQSAANRFMHDAFQSAAEKQPFRYLSHSFIDKKKFAPVQAADLLAWQMFTDWKHGAERRPRRKDFESLIAPKNHRVVLLDEARITYHLERMIEGGALEES